MHVVILGGGFAGLSAALHLHKQVSLTIVEPSPCFTFTPLLVDYLLNEKQPCIPFSKKTTVVQGKATHIDTKERIITIDRQDGKTTLHYDYLVLSTGATPRLPERGAEFCQPYKTLADAEQLREQAKTAKSAVIVGAGATGIEVAFTLRQYVQEITILQGNADILPGFSQKAKAYVLRAAQRNNITILLKQNVQAVLKNKVLTEQRGFRADSIIWATGVVAHPLVQGNVLPDLSFAEHENIFVCGDCCPLSFPKNAQTARAMGKAVAENIMQKSRGLPSRAFSFSSKGSLLFLGDDALLCRDNLFLHGTFVLLLRRMLYLHRLNEIRKLFK
ncbi:MAG: FAD-dependent oxidoreductase [archaeon]